MNRTIEISSGTILRAILILLLLWFLFFVRDILILLFLAFIIVCAVDPIVDWLQRKKIPRVVSVAVLYALFFCLVVLVFSLLIPPLVNEINNFVKNSPDLLAKFSGYFQKFQDFASSHNLSESSQQFFSNLTDSLSSTTSGVFSQTVSILGGIFSVVIVFSVAFYVLVKERGVKKFVASVIPGDHKDYVMDLVDRIQQKMGRWLQGQLLLMLIIFALDYAGLLLLKVPYALILALLAGLLEIIPYIGPMISAVLALVFGFLISPVTGLLAFGWFAIMQQIEGNVIVPLVMRKAVGLNPVVVIVALLVGAKLAGVIGIIISVPIATVIGEIVSDLVKKPEEKEL